MPKLLLDTRSGLCLIVALFGALIAGCSDAGYGASDFAGDGGLASSPIYGPTGSGGSAAGDALDDKQSAEPRTNPFIMTAHEPRSTFAADVDTASYDLFRAAVEQGSLPVAESVRLEEYVNYFNYEYAAPSPDSAHPFAIHLDASPSLANRKTQLLRVGIQGKLPPAFVKKAANLVYLIDVSGSMEDVFSLVQHTLLRSLELLEPTDTVSIVTYAGSTRVALEPTPVSDSARIRTVIQQLQSEGSTNGGSGIHLAYKQAETGFVEGGINHVVLCTDGDFNVGVTSTQELVDLIVEKRRSGVTLTALGYGTYPNDAMLEGISNSGNGIYGVIASKEQANEYVDERLLASFNMIAKDVKLQVEFNPEYVLAYRLLGYENRLLSAEEFRNDVIDAGEIGAGHRVTALYEIVPVDEELPMGKNVPAVVNGARYSGTPEVDPKDFVPAKVRYKEPNAAETDPAYEVSQSLSPKAVADGFASAGSDLQWASAIATFAEIVKGSPYADAASLDAIASIVDAQAGNDARRTKFAELFASARPLIER